MRGGGRWGSGSVVDTSHEISSLKRLVLDHGSRDRDVILVRRTIHLGRPRGVGNLEWGGNGKGLGRGRSVYEKPGAKVGSHHAKGGTPSK